EGYFHIEEHGCQQGEYQKYLFQGRHDDQYAGSPCRWIFGLVGMLVAANRRSTEVGRWYSALLSSESGLCGGGIDLCHCFSHWLPDKLVSGTAFHKVQHLSKLHVCKAPFDF